MARWDKWVHAFRKSICPKVDVIARLEFELAYFEATGQLFSHDAKWGGGGITVKIISGYFWFLCLMAYQPS